MGVETQFIRHGDVQIACTVPQGEGPTLLWIPDWLLPIELIDQISHFKDFFGRLEAFCQWATYDPPGTGSSDSIPLDPAPGLGYWVDVVASVMDGLGWERTALAADAWGGAVALAFATKHPERASALVLCNPFIGNDLDADGLDALADAMAGVFATPEWVRIAAPSAANDPDVVRQWTRMNRQTIRPSEIRSVLRMGYSLDARDLASAVRCPVLVLGSADASTPVQGREVTDLVSDARYVELSGRDSFPMTPEDINRCAGEIRRFLTGEGEPVRLDRVLVTVLFTDIVSSTAQTIEKGDRGWRAVLDRHDEITRETVARYGGRLIKSTGDGCLATLDGPALAVRCAQAVRNAVRDLGIEIRAGLHTGEIELRTNDIGGTAVNIARRVCDSAEANEVRVSESVVLVVAGSGLTFDDLGPHELKGVPGTWRLYRARD